MQVLPKARAEVLAFGEQQMFAKEIVFVLQLLLLLSQKIVPNLRALAELSSGLMHVAQVLQLMLGLLLGRLGGAAVI